MHGVALGQFANEYDMSKNSDDSEKISWWTNGWAVFGKFMAIMSFIGVVVTIYINLFPSGPDLVGRGRYTDFVVPPNLEAAHDSLKNRTFPLGFGEDFVHSFQKYRVYVAITIQNEGDRIASDIVLDLPIEGIARITHQDKSRQVSQVARTVSLKELRPGNNVQVEIWTESHIKEDSEDEFRITYANGVGSIAFSKRFSGYQRFVADYIGAFILGVLFWVLVLMAALLGWWLAGRGIFIK